MSILLIGAYPCLSLVYSIYKYVSLRRYGYHWTLLGDKISIEEINKPHKMIELVNFYQDFFNHTIYKHLYGKFISDNKTLYSFTNYSDVNEEIYINNNEDLTTILQEFNIKKSSFAVSYPILALKTENKTLYLIKNELMGLKFQRTMYNKLSSNVIIHNSRHGLILNYVRMSRLPLSFISAILFLNVC